MPVHSLGDQTPEFADRARAYIAPDAHVVGQVRLGLDVSVWFGAVLRGDKDLIEIGDGSNIQDGAVIHADPGQPTVIGPGCTVGHRAIVHSANVGPNCLVGMGATVLNGAQIGANSLVGANALVTENKVFPEGSLIVGAPAKAVRALKPEEIEGLKRSADGYVANGRRFATELRPAEP
jgi:carbonic anhydrase/acetyltransferase-like protein (isoleucine patch superfamily)